jgi:hypothetical protein
LAGRRVGFIALPFTKVRRQTIAYKRPRLQRQTYVRARYQSIQRARDEVAARRLRAAEPTASRKKDEGL